MSVTTKVVSSNPVHNEVYSIQHYVIKFVSDLREFDGFHRVLRFPPPRYNSNIVESGVKHHKLIIDWNISANDFFLLCITSINNRNNDNTTNYCPAQTPHHKSREDNMLTCHSFGPVPIHPLDFPLASLWSCLFVLFIHKIILSTITI